jgi:hypothetical protein
MSGETLKVNPEVLQSAGRSFVQVADGLASVQAYAPLGDAAGAAGQLLTADACRKAQQGVAAAATAAIESARKFGGNLNAAARSYVGRDQDSAAEVEGIDIPR